MHKYAMLSEEHSTKLKYIHGHGLSWHCKTSVSCPVQLPPLDSSTNLTRVFVLVPVPHEAEQSPTTQSSHTQ